MAVAKRGEEGQRGMARVSWGGMEGVEVKGIG